MELSYSPREWQEAYKCEKNHLHHLLSGHAISFEHIGATSIPECGSNRNIDVLIAVTSLADLSAVTLKLENAGYKFMPESSELECSLLIRRKKVRNFGVSVRVVLKASHIHNRIKAFKYYLLDSNRNVKKYNEYRKQLYQEANGDWNIYNERKKEYINSIIDKNFRFE